MNEGEAFIRDAAIRRGIDPDIAIRVAMSEGGKDAPGLVGKFNTGWSFWQFQLHYAMAGKPGVTNPTAGMGEGFTALTGAQPGDPKAWRDSVRYALNRAKLNGWGAWYGAAHVGVGRWDGIDRNHPWNANSERWDYESGANPMPPTTLPYDPDAPIDVQPGDWQCALESVQWLLRSIGRNPDANDTRNDPWLKSQLVPAIISPQNGLEQASGKALAAWLTREYGAEMGFVAHAADVTYDDVLAGAGHNPTIIGGRRWGPAGHWAGVRRADENGWLELANPSPGYTGVGTHLDRAEWDARGPWSAIYIDRLAMGANDPPPLPPAPPAPTLADVRARLVALTGESDDRILGRYFREHLAEIVESIPDHDPAWPVKMKRPRHRDVVPTLVLARAG